MPRSFRVAYAGKPESGVFLKAQNWREAAYLFFANNPVDATVIVETSGYSEESITFAELATAHPEARELLKNYAGQKGVLQETLEREHGLQSTAKADEIEESHLRGKLYILILRIGLPLLGLIIWGIYNLLN